MAVLMPPLMSAVAAVMRALLLVLVSFGTTSAARMPMIMTTSSISTSVNPRFSFAVGIMAELVLIFIIEICLMDVLTHRQHRQQHTDEDDSDETGNQKEHQWFGEGDGGFEMPIQIHLGHIRNADEFRVEFSAFFGHRHHFQD